MTQLLNILVFFGFVQGVISSFLLFSKAKKNPANKSLGWIILLMAMACLNIYMMYGTREWSYAVLVLFYCLPLIVAMPIGPLLYRYVLCYTSPSKRVSRTHFYPIVIDLVPPIAGIVFFSGQFMGLFSEEQFRPLDRFLDAYHQYSDIPRWISVAIYSWISYRLLANHSKWPKQLVLGFLIFLGIWLIHLVPYMVPKWSEALLENYGWYPIYIPLVVLIYWLGYNGIVQSKSGIVLNDETSEDALIRLKEAMEKDLLYRNPKLRLDDVVEQTGLSQKLISTVLNQKLKKSFNEFVNQYRIEEVKERMIDPMNDHLTISGIALESGFNSQATFQRTFKALEHESPRSYRSRMNSEKNTQI